MRDLDPFDLPDWLGTGEVTWEAIGGLRSGCVVTGRLRGAGPGEERACDLLAVDEAYPAAVAPDDVRLRAHRAWRHGQVALVDREGRLTLVVPGHGLDAERVLEALARLAKAVGGSESDYAALLRLGSRTGQPADS